MELTEVVAANPLTKLSTPLIQNLPEPAVMKLIPAELICNFSVFSAPISTEFEVVLIRHEPKAEASQADATLKYPKALLRHPEAVLLDPKTEEQTPEAMLANPPDEE